MAEVKATITLKDIQKLVQQIVERFHPRKVILFGSYAYGQPHEGSDLDLLVIVLHPLSHREGWQAVRELRQRCPLPLQVFFMSSEEFEETKDVIGGLAHPAHHWGRVLYEENT